MKKVYVCTETNTAAAKELAKVFCMAVIEEENAPICPGLFYDQVLNEGVEWQKAAGEKLARELMEGCSELRIYSRLSEEMKKEISWAEELGIPVLIGNLSYIYSDARAVELTGEIWDELGELGNGKEYYPE